MKRLIAAMLIGLAFAIATSDFSAFAEDYSDIQNNVLRLHILANSDSTEDQQLKLKVRNAVLTECSYIFEGKSSEKDSKAAAEENLRLIEATAQKVVIMNGYSYDVKCEVVNMKFDRRVYGEITMPEGMYDAVRITIGKAEGKNWWCVMYPPLCVPAAQEYPPESYFTDGEMDIMLYPQKYEVKFKCVELYEYCKNKLTEEQ